MLPSSEHTIGPFFPQSFFREGDNDLRRITAEAAPSTRGETITIHGVVLKADGVACVNMVLEAWQADAAGRFNHEADPEAHLADPDFLGWGRAWTDAEGAYDFRTIIPGGYRDAAGPRAPHINLGILGSGIMRRLVTTLYFPAFAAENAADPVLTVLPAELRPHLVVQPDGEVDGTTAFRFDILLRGEAHEETPFFLD